MDLDAKAQCLSWKATKICFAQLANTALWTMNRRGDGVCPMLCVMCGEGRLFGTEHADPLSLWVLQASVLGWFCWALVCFWTHEVQPADLGWTPDQFQL